MIVLDWMKKNKIIVVVVGILILSLVVFGITRSFKSENTNNEGNDQNNIIGGEEIYNPVSYNEVDEIYNSISQKCDGVIVFDGDKIESDGEISQACKSKDSYQQKMIGYSYEGENVVLYINIVQIKDGKVFSLTGEELGVYDEGQMQTLLDLGTTYLYKYAKENDQFKLLRIEKMNRIE